MTFSSWLYRVAPPVAKLGTSALAAAISGEVSAVLSASAVLEAQNWRHVVRRAHRGRGADTCRW